MKISLITLHRIVNYGSVLQTYATQTIFEKLGHKVEVVDYFTERMTQQGMLRRIKTKKSLFQKVPLLAFVAQVIMLPSYKKRFSVFMKFAEKYYALSEHVYTCEKDFQKFPVAADAYCTGSDQTWNSLWNEKVDRPFYLSYAPDDKKKFSYAASFGRTSLEKWEAEPTKELLSRYSAISMRETSGVTVLEQLGLKGRAVLDPTLLLKRQEWEPLISRKYAQQKYILVYNINREKGLDLFAQRLSKEKNLPIYFMSYQYHDFYKKGKLICCPEVSEFLGLIGSAQYVITDSFHCTAFSTNFKKQVMVYYPHKFSTRLESLVNLTQQQSRVVNQDTPLSVADEDICFSKIEEILAKERDASIAYIEKALQ